MARFPHLIFGVSNRMISSLYNRCLAFATLGVFLVSTTGCSLVAGGTQRFSVNSEPSGALVFINGNNAGSTPLETRIPRRQNAIVIVRKKGYHPATLSTSRDLSTVGAIDVIAGIFLLVPLLGLFSGGAYVQTPKQTFVNLAPTDSSAE